MYSETSGCAGGISEEVKERDKGRALEFDCGTANLKALPLWFY